MPHDASPGPDGRTPERFLLAILSDPEHGPHPAEGHARRREAAHEVVQEAVKGGVWVFGGGLASQKASIVGTDGTVADGPYPEAIGGLTVVDVSSRAEALEWARKIAVACRCAQEVREVMLDPELDEMLRQAQAVTPRDPQGLARAASRRDSR